MVMVVMAVVLPPTVVERHIVVILPIAVTPMIANVVGHVEPLAVAPAPGPVAVVTLAELTAAPFAPTAVAVTPIPLAIAEIDITVAPISAVVANSRDPVTTFRPFTGAIETAAPIGASVTVAPVSFARTVQIGNPSGIIESAARILAVPIPIQASSTRFTRTIRVVAAQRPLAATVSHIQKVTHLLIRG
jgi:hypothetical protein